MKLYVKCTTDEYQLPEIIADSAQELARKTGKSAGSIATMISKGYPGWYKVDIGKSYDKTKGNKKENERLRRRRKA